MHSLSQASFQSESNRVLVCVQRRTPQDDKTCAPELPRETLKVCVSVSAPVWSRNFVRLHRRPSGVGHSIQEADSTSEGVRLPGKLPGRHDPEVARPENLPRPRVAPQSCPKRPEHQADPSGSARSSSWARPPRSDACTSTRSTTSSSRSAAGRPSCSSSPARGRAGSTRSLCTTPTTSAAGSTWKPLTSQRSRALRSCIIAGSSWAGRWG